MGIEFEQTQQQPPQGQVQMPQCMEVKKTRDKVCIVGCAESKNQTPFDKADEYEFWGVNNLYLTMPDKPWTRWFEIHRITHEENKWLRRGKPEFRGSPVDLYLKGLGNLKCPVYMQLLNPLVPGDIQFVKDLHAIVPNAVPFPLKQIVEQFGPYFTNTVSWEIALAISEGYKEIRVYGVDMAVDTEYHWQRPSCEYFLGLALGRGIKIWIPDSCDLLKSRFLYGFQEHQALPFENKIQSIRQTIQKKHADAARQLQFLQKQLDQYAGAGLGIEEIMKTWKNVTGA